MYSIPLFIDQTGKIKRSATTGDTYSAINRVILKRGDTVNLAIKFLDNSSTPVPYLLTAGSIVQVAIKEKGKYGSGTSYAAFGSTGATPSDAASPYIVGLSIAGSVIDSLIGVGNQTESPYVDVMFEVSWSEDSGSTWNSTSEPVEARVYNDAIRADTDVPALPSNLNIPQVYYGSISTVYNNSQQHIIDLAAQFGLKEYDVAQFEIKAQGAIRKPWTNGQSSAVKGIAVYEGIVRVDLSSNQNYASDVPYCMDTVANGAIESLSADAQDIIPYGTTSVVVSGGGGQPDAAFGLAARITLDFSHVAASVDPQEFFDVQWEYRITKVGVTNYNLD